VLTGGTDEELLAWVVVHGKPLTPEEIEQWSQDLVVSGPKDDAARQRFQGRLQDVATKRGVSVSSPPSCFHLGRCDRARRRAAVTDHSGGTKDFSVKKAGGNFGCCRLLLPIGIFNGRGLYGRPCRAAGLAGFHAGLGDCAGASDDLSGVSSGFGECLAGLVQSLPDSLLIEDPAGDLVDHAEGLCGPRGCLVGLPECLVGLGAGRGGLPARLLPLHRRSAQRRAVVPPRERVPDCRSLSSVVLSSVPP
jgi:hypothetical protein